MPSRLAFSSPRQRANSSNFILCRCPQTSPGLLQALARDADDGGVDRPAMPGTETRNGRRQTRPDLPGLAGAPANVRAVSTTRGGGASAERHTTTLNLGHPRWRRLAERVAANRARGARIGRSVLGTQPGWLDQVHGHGRRRFRRGRSRMGIACRRRRTPPIDDASAGRVCVDFMTADCLPDPARPTTAGTVVAAAHGGLARTRGPGSSKTTVDGVSEERAVDSSQTCSRGSGRRSPRPEHTKSTAAVADALGAGRRRSAAKPGRPGRWQLDHVFGWRATACLTLRRRSRIRRRFLHATPKTGLILLATGRDGVTGSPGDA